jgi:hypothetical protein
LSLSAGEENYRVVVIDDVATCVIPALAAAITVPNMMTAEMIAANIKPAVFMYIPLREYTHEMTERYGT